MEPGSQCRALNVSDEQRCGEIATSTNGMFCAFHSRQCQGLYRGYKRRNERLDKLNASPPAFLTGGTESLTTQTFETVDSKELCQELHGYLFLKYQLLDRVIRTRKLHHSRFFSMDMDYGHEKYLDVLQGQRATVMGALERLERRTVKVLYEHEQWFDWVRECQNEEEETRMKEQKKVKMEAALFQRNWKATQQRLKDAKAKEDQKRQDAFLEKIYEERMSEEDIAGEYDDAWDPIEEILEDNRNRYIGLIQHFLWISTFEDINTSQENEDIEPEAEVTNATAKEDAIKDVLDPGAIPQEVGVGVGNISNEETPLAEMLPQSKELNVKIPHSKKGSASKKSKSKSKPKHRLDPKKAPAPKAAAKKQEEEEILHVPDKSLIETREQMAHRLRHGTEYSRGRVAGVMVAGTIENPVIQTTTKTFPDEQVEELLTQVSEIKNLLFCRLLLSHATLLPAALRANSVEEFIADPEIPTAAPRDICLKTEQPSFQDVRDACADLFRPEDEADEDDIANKQAELAKPKHNKNKNGKAFTGWAKKPGDLPDEWIPKNQKEKEHLNTVMPDEGGGAVDFSKISASKSTSKKIRVKICGRNIWNYPSDKAMNRGGWLQFCIIAKDSRLEDAVALCRHWDEFLELNTLASWQFFPAANWNEWVGSRMRQQMLQMGFIMYFQSDKPDAMEMTQHFQTGSRGRDHRRSHLSYEARNWICAHLKRDDQVSRRLIQYLCMWNSEVLVLVRDAESGKLLVTPENDQKWLIRTKSGLGRASKNEKWKVVKEMGPLFFEEMHKFRDWHFSFKEYYDVYVWDFSPGQSFTYLYNLVQHMLFKALRCRTGVEIYNPVENVLRSLYQDEETHRPREIKPEQEGTVKSIWDDLHSPDSKFMWTDLEDKNRRLLAHLEGSPDAGPSEASELKTDPPIRNLYYNDTDAFEDAILFPEEEYSDPLQLGVNEPVQKWLDGGLHINDWVEGKDLVDTDEEVDDSSDLEEQGLTDGESSDDDSSLDPSELSEGCITNEEEDEDEDLDLGLDPIQDATFKKLLRIRERRPPMKTEVASDRAGMEAEFYEFMDRQKAKRKVPLRFSITPD